MPLHDLLDPEDKEVSLTFGKGLSVILAFEGRNGDLSISEIAEKCGLNRAVTRRLVRTLEQMGFVSLDRGRYQLTPRVLRLTRGFMETRSIPQVVQPVLRAASHDLGESISFAMLDGDEAVYVAHAFIPSRFTLNMVTVGSGAPLAQTAVGRAIMAYLPPEDRQALLARLQIEPFTPHTQTDTASIEAALQEVRLTGYAHVIAEYVEGVASLAVPVLARSGAGLGALSMIFPKGQFSQDEIHRSLLPRLAQAAADIAQVF